MIRVQAEDFDIAKEIAKLTDGRTDIGALVTFTGLVREFATKRGQTPFNKISSDTKINTMTLEHYPGMTEKALTNIEEEANKRWPLDASLIVHRYGELAPGDQIVLVITASAHRQAAFEAAEFLVDWLKTKAPFWKLEAGEKGAEWVEARVDDDQAAQRWEKT